MTGTTVSIVRLPRRTHERDGKATMTVRYQFDPQQSRCTVRAFAGGMLMAFGHNPTIAIRDFTGEVQLTPDVLDAAALHVKIQAPSLAVIDNISRKDRQEMERQMREEVLETAHYPEIVFESTRVSAAKLTANQYRVQITGSLSLHGVTRTEQITAHVTVDGDTLRAHGAFTLRQTDYRIKRATAIGGALRLKDALQCAFDIVAQKDPV